MTDEELKIQAMIRFWKELSSSEQQLKMCEGCQIRWERDTAMEQLAEYHIPFLCVAPDVVEVVRCKDCIYYDAPHVECDGKRIEYAELPQEAFDDLGTGLVTCQYGINIGGRCTVDYEVGYSEDKRVFVKEINFCGRGERRSE